MAVAKNQIEEIIDAIQSRIGKTMTKIILGDLTKTETYIKNKSFKDTINRLQLKYVEQHFNLDQSQGKK